MTCTSEAELKAAKFHIGLNIGFSLFEFFTSRKILTLEFQVELDVRIQDLGQPNTLPLLSLKKNLKNSWGRVTPKYWNVKYLLYSFSSQKFEWRSEGLFAAACIAQWLKRV